MTDCSGIIKIDGKHKCKHGFPLVGACTHKPMEYNIPYCLNEVLCARLYPETGAPQINAKTKNL